MIKEPKELQFEEKRHLYTINGIKLPSVTEIIDPVSYIVYKGVDEFAKLKAGWRGTDVHFAIELYNDTGVIEIEEKFKGYLDAYLQFREDYKKRLKVLHSEMRTYHKDLKYAGTIDMIAELDGKRIIIDYKTTSQLLSYLVALQTPAYMEAVNSWLKDDEKKLEECYVLHLEKNGNYNFVKVDNRYDIFIKLYSVYGYINTEMNKK